MNENIGNVKSVVIDRDNLLSIIKENKAKHDALFDAALSGYWISTKDVIEKKVKEFKDYTKVLNSDFTHSTDTILNKISKQEKVDGYTYIPTPNASFSYSVNLKYPESHAAEYDRAIRSVSLNVYDKIELSETEFNQYVMNDWSWKSSFINSNNSYVTAGSACITGCYSNAILLSGCSIL